jgi:uncharacterized membrane protein
VWDLFDVSNFRTVKHMVVASGLLRERANQMRASQGTLSCNTSQNVACFDVLLLFSADLGFWTRKVEGWLWGAPEKSEKRLFRVF